MVLLESGINASAIIRAVDGPRRPAVLIRSSPAQAGTERTPWHDVIDLDSGIVTYFGDHKPNTVGRLGTTKGNKVLEEIWSLHASRDPEERKLAPPILFFEKTPWVGRDNETREKGAVRFLGPAVLEEFEPTEAFDERTRQSYPNYRMRLRLTNFLAREHPIDWSWINARKDPKVSLDESLDFEPTAWTTWRWSER